MGGIFPTEMRPSAHEEVTNQLDRPSQVMSFYKASRLVIQQHMTQLSDILRRRRLRKLILDDCFQNPFDTRDVLLALQHNTSIQGVHLSISYNRYNEEVIVALVSLIKTEKIKSIRFPSEVKAADTKRLLQAVLNRENRMDVLDLGDCELDDESVSLLKDVIEQKKIRSRLGLSRCTGDDGRKTLLPVSMLEELKAWIKDVYPLQFTFNVRPTIRLFHTEDTGRNTDHRGIRRGGVRLLNRVLVQKGSGVIMSIFFTKDKHIDKARYEKLNYTEAHPMEILLDVNENDEIVVGVQCEDPSDIQYKSVDGNTTKLVVINHVLLHSNHTHAVEFRLDGDIPDAAKNVTFKYFLQKPDGEEIESHLIPYPVEWLKNPPKTEMPRDNSELNPSKRPRSHNGQKVLGDIVINNHGRSKNIGLKASKGGHFSSVSQSPMNIGRTRRDEGSCFRMVDETKQNSEGYTTTESADSSL